MLDGIIQTGKLKAFIEKLIDSVNEERMWELWLHKPTGKSWEDFKLAVIPQDVDEKELCNAVCEIENILAGGG